MKLADTLTAALTRSQDRFLAPPPERSTSGRKEPYEEIHRASSGFLGSDLQRRDRAAHENGPLTPRG